MPFVNLGYTPAASAEGSFSAQDRANLAATLDWAEQAAREAAQGGVRLTSSDTQTDVERRFTVGARAGAPINTVRITRDATGAQTGIAPVTP